MADKNMSHKESKKSGIGGGRDREILPEEGENSSSDIQNVGMNIQTSNGVTVIGTDNSSKSNETVQENERGSKTLVDPGR